MDLERYLALMAKHRASDLIFSVGAPPAIKVNGETTLMGDAQVTAEQAEQLARDVMSEPQRAEFERTLEMNLALARDIGRFRVNLYRQRGHVAIAIRYITNQIPTLKQ